MDEFQPDIVYVHNTWFKASVGIFKFLEKQNTETLLKFIILDIFVQKIFLQVTTLKIEYFL